MPDRFENPSFVCLPMVTGMHYEDNETTVYSLIGKSRLTFMRGTYYVFVNRGYAVFSGAYHISAGYYGSFTNGHIETTAGAQVLIVHAKNYKGLFNYGGPIEEEGRLRYIDGCTDTGIIPPIRLGDPCLNHLHFPPRINQSAHTHPSLRVGCVAGGEGLCVTPWGEYPLMEGMQFLIMPENGQTLMGLDGKQHKVGEHSFKTDGKPLDVIAYHPDSEVGPTDEVHQMKAATKLISVQH